MNLRRALFGVLFVSSFLTLAAATPDARAAAARTPEPPRDGAGALPAGLEKGVQIPEALRPWLGWVLHGKEEELCPFLHGQGGKDREAGECAWPARLTLALRERGGTFTQSWRLYTRAWVPLPGDAKVWPQDVRVDGKPAVVVAGEDGDSDGMPKVLLVPGEHTVTGGFVWDELPESLLVPERTGLVALSVRGVAIPAPSRDDEGRLLLQKEAAELEEDVLELTVHRKITDSIPLVLTTRLSLRVAGKSREVVLGQALPKGFIPMSLDSPLPARLEPDSRLRVQARPGTHTLTLVARHDGPVEALTRPKLDGAALWPAEEVWVFEAQPKLRLVTVEGIAAIDPQQTTLPDEWKRLPAYPLKSGETLQLKQQRRGDADPAPDQLQLRRRLWLDFDGKGLTARDFITGEINRTWRLEVNPPTALGRVSADGKDLLITRTPRLRAEPGAAADLAGVEIRQGKIRIEADSRIPIDGGFTLPAVSWNADFQTVKTELQLPPGWRLLHASGVDKVPSTWLHKWTLLHLFVVLIAAMAVARLYGRAWGVLALIALALSVPEHDAPRLVWLAVLAAEALMRVLPAGRMTGLVRLLRLGSRIVLVLVLVFFATQQLRQGLYPALEPGHDGFEFSESSWLSESSGLSSFNKEMASPAEMEPDQNNIPVQLQQMQQMQQMQQLVPSSDLSNAPAAQASDSFEPKRRAKSGPMDRNSAMGKDDDSVLGGLVDEKLEEKVGGKRSKPVMKPRPYKNAQQQLRNSAYEFDPNAVVQTGPGMPRWAWNKASLDFSGPVRRDQQVRLYLLSPGGSLALALLQVLLLAGLLVRLCGLVELGLLGRRARAGGVATVLLLVLCGLGLGLGLGAGTASAAELPSQELLDELRDRVLKAPECRPSCASSPRLELTVLPKRLRARMEVGAATPTAVPLPGNASQWLPERVLLDGTDAKALLRTDDGKLWVALPEGSHQLILEGAMPSRETVQLPLPLRPHLVTATVQGWRLEGLHEDGLADDDLQLTRESENKSEEAAALQAGALPPLVTVERTVQLGLTWQVDTRVARLTPTGSAVVLEVPLLPGESVTTPDVRVQGGKALVNMAPSATEVVWHSLLQEKPQLELVAPKAQAWTELWRLSVSPIWHVELSGIAPVHQRDAEGLRQPEWRPWPGESVRIGVTRPEGIPGRSLTIDHSALQLRPGLRTTEATLQLWLRSSRGGQHALLLPADAELLGVTIDGHSQPLRLDGRRLLLPLLPGAQRIQLTWRQPAGIDVLFRSFEVDLGAPSVNSVIRMDLGDDRWVLLCGGPVLGPAVLFWGLLLSLSLVALGLGRVSFTPLRTRHWLLLGIGLTQTSLPAAALLVGWLLLLGWRGRDTAERHWAVFDLRQILLVGMTLISLGILYYAIRDGLLGQPDMQIAGNGSHGSMLRWFADRIPGVGDGFSAGATSHPLPRPWVLSVPVLAYRGAMLLWALWIAAALLGWLRWGYGAFSWNGLWRKRPPRPPKADKSKTDADAEPAVAAGVATGAKTDVAVAVIVAPSKPAE